MNIHIKSILAALTFSLLFYSKNFGLNVFLISLIISSLLAVNQKEKPIPWIYLIAFCLSGLMVFISPSVLNLFACLVSLLVLIGKTIATKS